MTTLTLKNKYQKDISTLAAGTELIGYPCLVHEITITSDAAGDASVSISNSTTSYSSSTRLAKINATDEQQTKQLVYPKGKLFSSGVSAVANKASVDIAITFE